MLSRVAAAAAASASRTLLRPHAADLVATRRLTEGTLPRATSLRLCCLTATPSTSWRTLPEQLLLAPQVELPKRLVLDAPLRLPELPDDAVLPALDAEVVTIDGVLEPIAWDCANRSPLARIPKPANKGSRPRCVVMRKLRKRLRSGK